jgi:outer membrane immunogenic protein
VKNLTLTLSTAVLGSALLGIGNVSAADLPVKARPYIAAAPAFSWTGCYVGGNAGYINDRTPLSFGI